MGPTRFHAATRQGTGKLPANSWPPTTLPDWTWASPLPIYIERRQLPLLRVPGCHHDPWLNQGQPLPSSHTAATDSSCFCELQAAVMTLYWTRGGPFLAPTEQQQTAPTAMSSQPWPRPLIGSEPATLWLTWSRKRHLPDFQPSETAPPPLHVTPMDTANKTPLLLCRGKEGGGHLEYRYRRVATSWNHKKMSVILIGWPLEGTAGAGKGAMDVGGWVRGGGVAFLVCVRGGWFACKLEVGSWFEVRGALEVRGGYICGVVVC